LPFVSPLFSTKTSVSLWNRHRCW